MNEPVNVQTIVQQAVDEYMRQDVARREPAYKTELHEERRRREQLEKRVNELVEENKRSRAVADEAQRSTGIRTELQKLGAPFKAFVLEDLAPRPLTELPREIAEDMETSDVSIFAVKVQRNELKSRMQMTDISVGLNISATNITKVVHGLEDDGLVRRVPHDDDKRRTWSELTAEGEAEFEEEVPGDSMPTHKPLPLGGASDDDFFNLIQEDLSPKKK